MATKTSQTTESPLERGISESTIAQITASLNTVKTLLAPYVVTLAPVERRRLAGAGIKNLGFTETAYNSASTNPSLVPGYLNITEFKNNLNDVKRKEALYNLVWQVAQSIWDSLLVAGDLAYHDALEYYNYVKEAARQRVPGAEAEYKRLKPYFKKSAPAATTDREPTQKETLRDAKSILEGKKEGKIVIENVNPTLTGGKKEVLDDVHTQKVAFKASVDEKITE